MQTPVQREETGADSIRSLLVAQYDHFTHAIGHGFGANKDLKSALSDPDEDRTLTVLEFLSALNQIVAIDGEIIDYRVKLKPSGLDTDVMWIIRDDVERVLWLNQ